MDSSHLLPPNQVDSTSTRLLVRLGQNDALCGMRDGTVHRLDLTAGKQEVVATGLGNVVEISPDGQLIASNLGGKLCIHRLNGQLVASFHSANDGSVPIVGGAEGHLWTAELPRGPFWATKGTVAHLVYVAQTASGQESLMPQAFAIRYGWQNDPSRVRLK
jgi:hypothetical protein